jgi:predicted amidohydrolase
MLFLPECFGFIGESSEQTLDQAEPPIQQDSIQNDSAVTETLRLIISNPEETKSLHHLKNTGISIMDGLRQISKASKLWISAGGMHVSGAPPDSSFGTDRVFNTHVIVDDKGEVKSIYRKIHLFDVSIPGKVNLRESATTAAGEDLVVCDSPIGACSVSLNEF